MMINLQYERQLVVFTQQLGEHYQRLRHNVKTVLAKSIDVAVEEEEPSRDQSFLKITESREKGGTFSGIGGELEAS